MVVTVAVIGSSEGVVTGSVPASHPCYERSGPESTARANFLGAFSAPPRWMLVGHIRAQPEVPMKVTVAAVQATPVFLDTDATVEKACG